jgi:DnaJ-class molecular chaperone
MVVAVGADRRHQSVAPARVEKSPVRREVRVIELLSGNRVLLQCARCEGSGQAKPGFIDSRVCRACGGKGKVIVEAAGLPLMPCAQCKGWGRRLRWDLDSKECRVCRGVGCQPSTGEMTILS